MSIVHAQSIMASETDFVHAQSIMASETDAPPSSNMERLKALISEGPSDGSVLFTPEEGCMTRVQRTNDFWYMFNEFLHAPIHFNDENGTYDGYQDDPIIWDENYNTQYTIIHPLDYTEMKFNFTLCMIERYVSV